MAKRLVGLEGDWVTIPGSSEVEKIRKVPAICMRMLHGAGLVLLSMKSPVLALILFA